MREVLGRTRRPATPVFWINAGLQSALLAMWAWRVLQGERGIAVLLTALFALSAGLTLAVLLSDLSSTLVLTDDALVVERRLGLRPRVIRRAEIRAVDGSVPGRPRWSEVLVLTVGERTVKLGGFDTPVHELIPRIRDWAGVLPADPSDRPRAGGPGA